MKENNIDGDTIYAISRHSNWRVKGIEKAFIKAGIYPQKDAWKKFIRFAIVTLGIAFTVSGIVFFFAFNWQYLHRFAKLGILEGLVIIPVLIAVFIKLKPYISNLLLTGASLLVGCLFAVFGQVYQTGANAYDFFLGWSVFIALWCAAAGFAPLWLLFLALVNITIFFYAGQVATNWPTEFLMALLFFVNAAATVIAEIVTQTKAVLHAWFIRLATITAIGFSTISIGYGIFETGSKWLLINLLLAIGFYSLAIWYSFKTKQLFYLTIIALSVVIIIATFILRATGDNYVGGFLLTSLFVVASITLLILQILKINKRWHGQPTTH